MCSQQKLRSACAYVQSDQSLRLSLEYSISVKLLTEHHLAFLSIEGGCTISPESTLVEKSHFWKSHVAAKFFGSKHNISLSHFSNMYKANYVLSVLLGIPSLFGNLHVIYVCSFIQMLLGYTYVLK